MSVRGKGVRAPKDNQPGKPQRFRIHADPVVAEGVPCAEPAGDCASVHDMARSAQRIPKALARAVNTLDQPHVSAANVRPDGLGAELFANPEQPRGNLRQRLVPGDALKASAALWADAAHRIEQTLRRPRVGDIVVELVAQRPAREWMPSVAFELDGSTILDRDDPTARVRTIHRAGAADALLFSHESLLFRSQRNQR